MSIGFTFTGRVSQPEALIEAARGLVDQGDYRMGTGENGLRVALCPLGGDLYINWRSQEDPEQPWLVWGECISTPAGAGLHRAAVELLDGLPIRELAVEDETQFYRHRDFDRMKREHFYPWLRTLVDVCRREDAGEVSGMRLCWDLEQYAPEDLPGTVITPIGRFRLEELVRTVEEEGIEALAGRFFLWDGRVRDGRFYRNRALNTLWERCYFAPSGRSGEDAAINAAILDDLERAAGLDPALPLPRQAYEEVCALAGRTPALPDGPALQEEFQPGYRRGPVTHGVGALRLTLPGVCRYEWEAWENGGGTHLWSDESTDSPVWRVNSYRMREGEAQFTDSLAAFHGVEGRELKGGALRWGWKDIQEDGRQLYLAECEVITGPFLFLVTAAFTSPGDLSQVAELIGRISVVQNKPVQTQTIQAQEE